MRMTATPCRVGRSGIDISPKVDEKFWGDEDLGEVLLFPDRMAATPFRVGHSGIDISPKVHDKSWRHVEYHHDVTKPVENP
ncbi:hypothetical protein J6590_021739 [Homalodisca vitripennis]|nr:hypothetical protein J6590_021739 [Homalodisca vitripennis]